MIELRDNRLVFSFSEIHEDAKFSVEFQRTLRIPDDNREYSLPPGFGRFPLLHVDDFADNLPRAWEKHGGVFLPMYQAEALWLNFESDYPFAVKVAAGKIDATTGEDWTDNLQKNPQNYLALPEQPWLDGFCISEGRIRQFVAMPLGKGYTAEEQITGEAEHGGIQIVAYPMKRSWYERIRTRFTVEQNEIVKFCSIEGSIDADMGLAPGGLMRQEIYEDPYGFRAWNRSVRSRCFIHIANSISYESITGSAPPTKPPTAAQYTDAGLPWFDYYAAEMEALSGSKKLAGLDSIAATGIKKGEKPLPENKPINPGNIKLIHSKSDQVREGKF